MSGVSMLPNYGFDEDLYLQDVVARLGLSDTLARTVALRYFDRLSWQEIAEREGVTAKAIELRLYRARKIAAQRGIRISRLAKVKRMTLRQIFGPSASSTFNAADHPG